jgi:hypothetical protein
VKINHDRKRLLDIEKDSFENPQNHNSTGDMRAELNIRFEDPVSTKTVRPGLHKSDIHVRATIAKPLITESKVQTCKFWCHDHKTWISDNYKRLDSIGV